jgi:putative oxidoreductase
MSMCQSFTDLVGRVLISAMFIDAGLPKIAGFAGAQAYMAAAGVPGDLLPAVIALEILGAVLLIVGYRTRIVAIALAAFTALAAVIFHRVPDPMQHMLLMKNLAITGGLLVLAARGAGTWSLDARDALLSAPGELLRRT